MDRRESGIHIGTRGWVLPEDASGFYPEDLPEDWMLEYYTTQFHALEIPPLAEPPDAETVAFWDEETLEDATLSLSLTGEWGRRLAAGRDPAPLARLLEPLGDKLAVLVWPQKPPTRAAAFWPRTLHLDGTAEILTEARPGPGERAPGAVYYRLGGPGRYSPESLDRLAEYLVRRGRAGRANFVFFTAVQGGNAILDAMHLQEAVEARSRE
ncbi:hypothetical protein [Thiohalorhabdus methylotrophus]|uniref:DUF72 domain-containing protein n=1 Tax=Thiohalorhabdus methylotrophus TaxID=3242694 RepID=A0ABV4TT08_9GAMM